MFRGRPLAGLADDAFSLRVEASLEEMRLEAMEARLDALSAAGDTGSVMSRRRGWWPSTHSAASLGHPDDRPVRLGSPG